MLIWLKLFQIWRQILDYVRGYKEEGNNLFKQKKFEEALSKYELGAKFLTFISSWSEGIRSIFWELATSISLNLAACYLKTKYFVQAGRICSVVLQFDSRNVKALFRRACAAMELGRTDLALLDLSSACQIEPSNKEVANKLIEAKKLTLNSPIQEDQESTPEVLSSSGLIPLKKNPKKRAQEEDEGTSSDNHNKRSSSFYKETAQTEMHQSSPIQTQKEMEDQHADGVKINSDDSIQTKEVDTLKDSSSNGKNDIQSLSPKEMTDQAEPKYRLYNRKRLGSFLLISKKDYQSIAQGKPITYFNSRTGSWVSIKSVSAQRSIAKTKDVTNATIKESDSKVDKEEDAMEIASDTVEGSKDDIRDHNPIPAQGSQQESPIHNYSDAIYFTSVPNCNKEHSSKMAARKRLREARWKARSNRRKLHIFSSTTYPLTVCRCQVGLKRKSGFQHFDSDQRPRKQALITSSCSIHSV